PGLERDEPLRRACPPQFVPRRGRYCPACLADDEVWRRSWLSPFSLACPRHRLLYHNECPGCGQRPWASLSWLGACQEPYTCTARTPAPPTATARRQRPWCGTDLRDAAHIAAPGTVLDAQTLFAHHLLGSG